MVGAELDMPEDEVPEDWLELILPLCADPVPPDDIKLLRLEMIPVLVTGLDTPKGEITDV